MADLRKYRPDPPKGKDDAVIDTLILDALRSSEVIDALLLDSLED